MQSVLVEERILRLWAGDDEPPQRPPVPSNLCHKSLPKAAGKQTFPGADQAMAKEGRLRELDPAGQRVFAAEARDEGVGNGDDRARFHRQGAAR